MKNIDRCIICSNNMNFFETKDFNGEYSLHKINYYKCSSCGFVISKEHYEMKDTGWEKLNQNYHQGYQGKNFNSDDHNWYERLKNQASIIKSLDDQKIFSKNLPWIDWGCGDGKLANLLNDISLPTLKYDYYMKDTGQKYLTDSELLEGSFELVINTSVFEHVRSIETLDKIAGLVSQYGVLAIHTLVRENIPTDPGWFYLLPVHCSFFTNKSMQILFNRWGFDSSLYHVDSRLWFWFKKTPDNIEYVLSNINKEKQNIFFAKNFMDYWK